MLLTAVLVKLSNDLYQLALKETASYVTEKIKSMRNDKDLTIIRSTYDELLSRLLDERAEAIRIAQVYKEELEKVSISDKDIEYLHNTVSSFLKMLSHFSPNSEENPFNENTADLINSLISKDVLKSMQLLGFNYKEAIGDPLTKLCADKISSFASNKTKNLRAMQMLEEYCRTGSFISRFSGYLSYRATVFTIVA